MRQVIPTDALIQKAEKQMDRLDALIPEAPGKLNDLQKWQLFQKNPQAAIGAVPPELQPAFIGEMQEIGKRYGTFTP
jgi:hypothetical protein